MSPVLLGFDVGFDVCSSAYTSLWNVGTGSHLQAESPSGWQPLFHGSSLSARPVSCRQPPHGLAAQAPVPILGSRTFMYLGKVFLLCHRFWGVIRKFLPVPAFWKEHLVGLSYWETGKKRCLENRALLGLDVSQGGPSIGGSFHLGRDIPGLCREGWK